MQINKFGIELKRINYEDLEVVRLMRIEQHVRDQMFEQEIITSSAQKRWFERVDTIHNYYFLIWIKGDPIGVVYGKEVDFVQGTSAGGIFIGRKDYLNTHYPLLATFIMLDLTFYLFNLKRTFAEVRTENSAQIRYNEFFGYRLIESEENGVRSIMCLDEVSYRVGTESIRRKLNNMYGEKGGVSWDDIHFEAADLNRPHLLVGFPTEIQGILEDQIRSKYLKK